MHGGATNLLHLVHEIHGGGAAAAPVPERVHHVAGEDEQQVGGAPVADGPQRAQRHEQEVHPVREPEQAADARRPIAAAARRGTCLVLRHQKVAGSPTRPQVAAATSYCALASWLWHQGARALYSW